jgi:predicted MFS family arabinose efflux permease
LAWVLSHSTTFVAAVALMDMLPVVVMGPVTGAFADRVDSLKVVQWMSLLSALIAVIFTILSFTQWLNEYLLLILALLGGITTAYNLPAAGTLLPRLVTKEDLTVATSASSIVFNFTRFIGPLFAGTIISLGTPSLGFLLNALSYLVYIVNLRLIDFPEDDHKKPKKRHFLQDITSGYVYVYQYRDIFWMMVIVGITSFSVRPFVELLSGYVGSALPGGSDTFSILMSSNGVGAIVAGLWLGRQQQSLNLLYVAFGGSLIACCAMMAFAAAESILVAAFFSAMIGFGLLLNGIGSLSLLQILADHDKRGRVLSLYYTLFRGGLSSGAAAIGLAGDHLGIVSSFEWSGALGLLGCVIMLSIMFYHRSLRG